MKNIPSEDDLPTFPDSVFENLPAFLQKVVDRCSSSEERDMMLLGSLTTIGSGLPKVYGYYGEKRVYPYLFLFITAQASAGKGKLELCRQLVNPIHDALREKTKMAKQEYKTGMKSISSGGLPGFGMAASFHLSMLYCFIPVLYSCLSNSDCSRRAS